jgi:ribosomal protein S18 acetylase RimI-like enzyme
MTGALSIGAARPEEREPAFQLILQHTPTVERPERIANALNMVRRGELAGEGLLVARQGDTVIGAMVCLPVAGASALLWPPQTHQRNDQNAIEDQLLGYALSWLESQGVRLVQALLTEFEAGLAAPLERTGFRHITGLKYMRREPRPAATRENKAVLRFQPYRLADPVRFRGTLLATYEETLDCPEISGIRTVEQVIAGHRAQGQFDDGRWWLAWLEEEPVGVLLTIAMPDTRSWDLSYLGLVPSARQRGLGKLLLDHALDAAASAGASSLTLCVDRRNFPALRLYERAGFQAYEEREVYLAIVRDTRAQP